MLTGYRAWRERMRANKGHGFSAEPPPRPSPGVLPPAMPAAGGTRHTRSTPGLPDAPPPVLPPVSEGYRPYRAADPTEEQRNRNLIILGVVILIGFLLPVVARVSYRETRLVFINFMALTEDRVPALIKFMFIYPGLAGAAVIILAAAGRGLARSIALMAIGFLPFAVLLGSNDVQRGLRDLPQFLPFGTTAALVIGFLGFMGLYVGSRSRSYRPYGQAAAVIGLIGGIAYLAGLILPVLPDRMGTIPLVTPFKMLDQKSSALTGLGMLASMACLIASSVICLVNVPLRPGAEGRAGIAFRLLVIGCIAAFAGGFFDAIRMAIEMESRAEADQVLTAILAAIKMGCWIIGLLLLVPAGVTDLVVSLSPATTDGGQQVYRSGRDLRDDLQQLKSLLDEGLISLGEYESKKADLLARL